MIKDLQLVILLTTLVFSPFANSGSLFNCIRDGLSSLLPQSSQKNINYPASPSPVQYKTHPTVASSINPQNSQMHSHIDEAFDINPIVDMGDFEKQKKIENALVQATEDMIIHNQLPKKFGINELINHLPENSRYDFTYRLLQAQTNSREIAGIISGLKPMSGIVEAVHDYFSKGNGKKYIASDTNSFSTREIHEMFDDTRFKDFFPHLSGGSLVKNNHAISYSAKHVGMTQTFEQSKLAIALQSSPRSSRPMDLEWIHKSIENRWIIDDVFNYLWGFHPLKKAGDVLAGMNSSTDQIRAMTVQGFHSQQNISFYTEKTERGREQVERLLPSIASSVARGISSKHDKLSSMSNFEKRLFIYQWGKYNADQTLINSIRVRADEAIAMKEKDFWDIRVEIHNFPSLDTIRDVENYRAAFIQKKGNPEIIKELDTLIIELKTLLGVGSQNQNRFNDTINSLTMTPDNKVQLVNLAKDFDKMTEPNKLDLLIKVRKEFQVLKNTEQEFIRDLERFNGDHQLSEQAMVVSSKLVRELPVPKTQIEVDHTINVMKSMLNHVELDDMLTSQQVDEIYKAIDSIQETKNLTPERKLELALSLSKNAVDQAYFELERLYGRYDNLLLNSSRSEHNPIRFIDGTMRSQNIFMLSQLIDKIESGVALSKNIKHTIVGKDYTAPVEVFNPGESMGILRIDKNPMELTDKEIGVFSQMPAETGALSGIITLGTGARLSHLQLLAKSLQIPNAKVSKEYMDILKSLDGKLVKFKTTKEGKLLIEEAENFGRAQSDLAIEIPKANHAINRPISFQEAGNSQHQSIAGPKGIQLSKMYLNPVLKNHVPDGFILPFGFFQRYADEIGLTPWIDMLSKVNLENKHLVSYITGVIRKKIDENPVPLKLLNEVQSELQVLNEKIPNAKGFFFRSDTNIEDLPNFNGAGLNESVPNVGTNSESVDEAIRTVWKSPFKEKSIYWRGMALGRPNVTIAEPSIVVMPTIEAQSSGVIISRGGKDWKVGEGSISSNWGIGSVVEAGKPVEEITLETGKINRFSFTVSNQKPVASENGGLIMEPISPGMKVLTDIQINELNRVSKIIDGSLGESSHGWDIEWAVDQDGKIIILQARPNM